MIVRDNMKSAFQMFLGRGSPINMGGDRRVKHALFQIGNNGNTNELT